MGNGLFVVFVAALDIDIGIARCTMAVEPTITTYDERNPQAPDEVRVAGMSYDGVDVFSSEHDALQSSLVSLSTNAERRVARHSSHMIGDSDPWLVIEEIGKLVYRASN